MKNTMLVMMYSKKTNVGEMFSYDFDKEIKLEIIKNLVKVNGSSELVRSVRFNSLQLDEILNYLVKTVDDLYEPEMEVYTICESGKNYILNILEALKQRCGVPFADELQQKWESIIDAISKSKYVYSSAWDYMSIADTRNKFREMMGKKKDKPCDGIYGRVMHEDGHPFRAINMLFDNMNHSKPASTSGPFRHFNSYLEDDTDIPKDLSSFKSICIDIGGIISMSSVSGGKIISSRKRSLESFFNAILGGKYEEFPFVASAEDAATLYSEFLKLYTGKEDFSKHNLTFTKFLGRIITVDIDELFKDDKDKTWDDRKLAKAFLEKDSKEENKKYKSIAIVTDNEDYADVDENGTSVLDCNKSKILDDFGIDKSGTTLVSCIIISKDESMLKFKKLLFECLNNIEEFGVQKIYFDASIEKSQDKNVLEKFEFLKKEFEIVFPEAEIEYKA